jgi:hypothetical protein
MKCYFRKHITRPVTTNCCLWPSGLSCDEGIWRLLLFTSRLLWQRLAAASYSGAVRDWQCPPLFISLRRGYHECRWSFRQDS